MEVQGRQDEIDQLNIQMAELNCKLQERIVKVSLCQFMSVDVSLCRTQPVRLVL